MMWQMSLMSCYLCTSYSGNIKRSTLHFARFAFVRDCKMHEQLRLNELRLGFKLDFQFFPSPIKRGWINAEHLRSFIEAFRIRDD